LAGGDRATEPILRVCEVSKSFGGIRALDRVSFDIARAHVHAVVGENGAGKSTLMKILAGVHPKDSGQVFLDGRLYEPADRRAAQKAGVGIVYQEPTLCPNLSVAENLFLGNEIRGRLPGSVSFAKMRERARPLLDRVGLDLPPQQPVGTLSIAQRHMVQIARTLAFHSPIIILDEPTAALTENEIERLFDLIRNLNQAGATIIYISHKIREIFEIAHDVTVLRDGRHIDTRLVAETTQREVVGRMVGRDFDDRFVVAASGGGAVVLETVHLSSAGKFADVNLRVAAGEVVALAGLVGSGRSELARAIFGIDPVDSGDVIYEGRPVVIDSPSQAVALGMGLVPEDRKLEGLILDMSIQQNIALPRIAASEPADGDALKLGGVFLSAPRARALAERLAGQLDIRLRSVTAPVQALSGGNQQKVVIAKWLALRPRFLILDEPTKGIDVGAKSQIHKLIRDLAAHGVAVLMISSELPEILTVSDRIYVMHEGRIVGHLMTREADEQTIMTLATRTHLAEPTTVQS
jgi:ABC-type sugar transport system ATPase subunit